MAKSTKYLSTSNGHIVASDGWFLTIQFSKIPKQPDMDFPKKIIYEVFDHFKLSQYIRSLSWLEGLNNDCIYKYFPVVSFNYVSDDAFDAQKDLLIGELIHILCTKWNKTTTG